MDNALKILPKLIQLNDTMASIYNDRGMVYLLLLDYKLAKKDFERAVNIEDKNAEYYFNLAYVCTKMIKMDNAVLYYNKSLELAPSNYDAFVNRAYVHCVQQHFKLAIQDYDSALKPTTKVS
jgi:tetratricopeptide (TPR) repeat protein